MTATYNEIEPYAAQWLRNLSDAGHIAPGEVITRSIKELDPDEIRTPQFHAFAGIGVWSAALRDAAYPDDFNIWSGSCPCQPFSIAGKKGKRAGLKPAGFADARHLWPDWFRLISKRRPAVVVGEQVASPDGLAWLDAVHADMEGAGYAFAAFDLCAAGFGAPHIRQRLYFAAVRLADSDELARRQGRADERGSNPRGASSGQRGRLGGGRGDSGLADTDEVGRGRWPNQQEHFDHGQDDGWSEGECQPESRGTEPRGLGHADLHGAGWNAGAGARAEGRARLRPVGDVAGAPGAAGRLGFAGFAGLEGHAGDENASGESRRLDAQPHRPAAAAGPTNGFWRDVEWLPCRDGKWRPTKPGLRPLVDGAAQRVGRLRAYGNAIAEPQAKEFLVALRPSVEHLWLREAA